MERVRWEGAGVKGRGNIRHDISDFRFPPLFIIPITEVLIQ